MHPDPRPRRILITGGAGFIGSEVARSLLARGDSVVALDIAPFDRLTDLSEFPNLVLTTGDVCDAACVDAWVSSCDAVMHFAAEVGVDRYIQAPLNVLDVNISGSLNVLRACKTHDRPVLLASTSEVFGVNTTHLSESSDRCHGPSSNSRWSYAVSKSVMEQYAHAMKPLGLQMMIVRYFNVYGARMDAPGEGRVISKYIGFLSNRQSLPLVDGGKAVRAFCYIDDAVEATLRVFDRLCAGREFSGESFNIGREEPVTIEYLARCMIQLSGLDVGTRDIPGRRFFGEGFEEIHNRVPNVGKLWEVTGFRAETPLVEGLRKTLEPHGLLGADTGSEGHEEPEAVLPAVRPCYEPGHDLLEAVRHRLTTGVVTNNGPALVRLEQALGERLKVSHLGCVGNGSMALLGALTALSRPPGLVILPSFTYIATVNAVVLSGHTPLFCDIDPDAFTMDPAALERIVSRVEDVRAVLPVNVHGLHPPLAAIRAIADGVGAAVIYDNCHGVGSEADFSVEDLVDAQVVSLHATKILPAIEGGAVASREETLVREVKRLCTHGLSPDPLASGPGYNGKMDELSALVALSSLARLDQHLANRRRYADTYRTRILDRHPACFAPQRTVDPARGNYQNFGVRHRLPDTMDIAAVQAVFALHGVEARRYFWPPLHQMAAFSTPGCELPQTDAVAASLLCWPMHSRMTERDLDRVVRAAHAVAAVLGEP